MNYMQYKFSSPLGPLFIIASEQGIIELDWKKKNLPLIKTLNSKSKAHKNLSQAARELKEYFAGKRTTFEIALSPEGTEFQQKVWKELRKIPHGKTVSYKNIADKIPTKGVRAVGTANGRNPLPIFIPCHRVIASNGSIGGYSGGIKIKKFLLALETSKHFD